MDRVLGIKIIKRTHNWIKPMECVFICMLYSRAEKEQAIKSGTVTSSRKYHLGFTTNPCSQAMALASNSIPTESDRCFPRMTIVYRLIIGNN